jgi:hypothetical protein
MVAAPATASDLMNCRRDVVVSIVVVLERKDSTRIELIATDFSGSIRGGQYTSVKSMRQFTSEIAGAGLHFGRLQTFNIHNSTTAALMRIANHDPNY